MARARLRGIYATALTERLRSAVDVVAPSPAIAERFADEFVPGPADVELDDSPDRRGVGLTGAPAAVETVLASLTAVASDALAWADPTPRGATVDATVTETLGSGAVVDLGAREGFLPYDAVGRRVEAGDELRVQVREPTPPWADRPRRSPDRSTNPPLLTWTRSAVTVDPSGETNTTSKLTGSASSLPRGSLGESVSVTSEAASLTSNVDS
jgi:hypothetical protein